VAGSQKRLHNDYLHSLYVSLYTIMDIVSRRMRYTGQEARMADMINEYKVLVGKPERNI